MERLDRNVMFQIMIRVSPRDVLALRRVIPRFFRMNVFKQLMEIHYPDSVLTDDPKAQYIAITCKFRTYYVICGLQNSNDLSMIGNPRQLCAPNQELRTHIGTWEEARYGVYEYSIQRFEMLPKDRLVETKGDPVFYVKGLPITSGAEMWIAFQEDHWGYELVLYNSKEKIAEYISKNCEDYLDALVDHFRDDLRGLGESALKGMKLLEVAKLPAFSEYLSAAGYVHPELIPFTEESIFKFVMQHDHFQPEEDVDHNNWIFFKRTF